MSDLPLNQLSASEIASLVNAGDVTCEQVARSCIERIAQREPVVKAWAYFDPDHVLRQARELDARSERGPLHGVPVGVKDIIDTVDMPTEMGSPIYRGCRPPADASCVALLRAAGAIILGKTVTCEFAGATPGVTTNPHDPSRTPGGSSSGSAAAVADFMVPLAIGTQTGGSVQRPSSYCGIVGFKPTFDAINTAGMKPAAQSLDTIGLMARSVEDIELSFRVLTHEAAVVWLSEETPVRVRLCRTPSWDMAEPATRSAVEGAAQRLASLGVDIREVTLPEPFAELAALREVVNDYERARGMSHEWQLHRSDLSEGLARTIRNGLSISAARYIEGRRRVEHCQRLLADVFSDTDVLLAPTVSGEAPSGLSWTGDHRFQSIWTQMRTPALTLPTHRGPSGMPVGIQLVAAPYRDAHLLAVAQLLFRRLGPATAVVGTPSAA